jgi:hypothetical protein
VHPGPILSQLKGELAVRRMKTRVCIGLAAAALTAVGLASMASNAVGPSSAGVGHTAVTTSTLANGTVVYDSPNFKAP